MVTSLSQQATLAEAYIGQAWPQAKERAWGQFESRLRDIRRVIFCGCGDSHHAAYSLSCVVNNWCGLPAHGLSSMEAARYLVPHLTSNPRDLLLVGISASGETARTLEAVALARDSGLRTLGLTSSMQGTLSQEADWGLSLDLPEVSAGPGLLSYLASLLGGYALAASLAPADLRKTIDRSVTQIPEFLASWQAIQSSQMDELSAQWDLKLPLVFLGSGPAYGAAMFAAAKCIEATGQVAWAQGIEEWAHLEYFAEPADLPTWILSAGGASSSREQEIAEAASRIGRKLIVSEWKTGETLPAWIRESLAPLVLWAGPVIFADRLMHRFGQTPFRSFSGGRGREEGGGISRIRSSARISSITGLRAYRARN